MYIYISYYVYIYILPVRSLNTAHILILPRKTKHPALTSLFLRQGAKRLTLGALPWSMVIAVT